MSGRSNYFFSTIASICSINVKEYNIQNEEIIDNFYDNKREIMLKAMVNYSKMVISFSFDPLKDLEASDDGVQILYVKNQNSKENTITPSNIVQFVEIHKLEGSPLSGLHNILKSFWCPTLLQDQQWIDKLPSKVQQLLAQLETSLHKSTIMEQQIADGPATTAVDSVDVPKEINETIDEISFWYQVKDSPSEYKNLARQVYNVLSNMTFLNAIELDTMKISVVANLMDSVIFPSLKQLLNISTSENMMYPTPRYMNLLTIIGNSLGRFISKKLTFVDIGSKLGEIRIELQLASQILSNFCDITVDIVKSSPRLQKNSKDANDYIESNSNGVSYAKGLQMRIEQTLFYRTIYDELFQLLSSDDHERYNIDRLLIILKNSKPFLYNPQTRGDWERAIDQLNALLKQSETVIVTNITKLLKKVPDHSNNTGLYSQVLLDYKNLLQVKSIRELFNENKSELLSHLLETIRQNDVRLERLMTGKDDELICNQVIDMDKTYSGNMGNDIAASIPISRMIAIRKLGTHLGSLIGGCKELLSEIRGCEKLITAYELISNKWSESELSLYSQWKQQVYDQIDSKSLIVKPDNSFLRWIEGTLVITIPPVLTKFIREVKILNELSYNVSSDSRISGIISEGMTFYNYAILMMKAANFYNSIDEQIIDIQRDLLAVSIADFTAIANKSIMRSTSKQISVDEYNNHIRTLQESAEKLSGENRYLRSVHMKLCNLTISLMNTDLLRNTDTWKAKWKQLKDTMNDVLSKYNESNYKTWVLHWDHQIYKALEVSYQMGLVSLNESLSDINVDLVFNGSSKSIEFKPPIESVRQQYYNEIKKFISIPNSFEGFHSNGHVFKRMCKTNMKSIMSVFGKAEALFDRLLQSVKKYAPWTKYASMDLDNYIETKVNKPSEFIRHFNMVESSRAEVSKLPDDERVDCVTISVKPFKSFLDDLYLRVYDSLLIYLRRGLLSEFKEVDTFLEAANEKLRVRPYTVEDITVANKCLSEFADKRKRIYKLVSYCLDKKKLLLQYAPGTAVDVTEVVARMANMEGEGSRLDDFDSLLQSYEQIIADQKEALKGTIEEDMANLSFTIKKLSQRWRQTKPSNSNMNKLDAAEAKRVFAVLDDWNKQFHEIEVRSDNLIENALAFNMVHPNFDGLEAFRIDIGETNKSWDILRSYYDELQQLSDQDWLTFSTNVYTLQDFAAKWYDNMKLNHRNATGGSIDVICDFIMTNTDQMKKCIPSLKYCRGEPFKEDHWTELLQGKLNLSKEIKRENVKLEHFLSRIHILLEPSTLTFVKNLQTRALGEVQIREALQEIKGWERSAEIKILSMDESGRRLPLLKDYKDLFLDLGDKQSLLASLKESQFFKVFEEQGAALESKMSNLDFILHTLNSIQRKWLYLEPIFGRGALPAEESRFKRVDEDFTDIVLTINRDPKLFYLVDEQIFPHLPDKLRTMLDQLERCQKALSDFLEAKRSLMPRFYFIGDDDLLEILGQSKNPVVIQSHLKKLFQGIHKVRFNKDNTKITAMVSSANEVVELESSVPVSEKVEEWLHLLATEMRVTLSTLLARYLKSSSKSSGIDWSYPSQVICLGELIRFTRECEDAITNNDLNSLLKRQTSLLRDVTGVDFSENLLNQTKMKSLVFDVVHNMDVVEQLLRKKTRMLTEWQWKKQLRYYYTSQDKAVVKMYEAQFEYTYEYQGNAPKLVHTPLTDKCYLTLTQGMHMGFGGNPYGPAGTGKTESVKALASCLGRQVLVFNCDEALESSSMVRIFIGIIKCGAWGCFDEFNRLKEDQLSAISQQIQTIQHAIKNRISPILLLNRSVDVNFNSGIFVTLNPAGKGYGGRSRLPDNLKALFRPVAMGAPDNEIIAEVSLVTEGFRNSKDLASKIVSLFKLSKQLLSPQQHYDWGLRALKAVLNSGGRLIQAYKSQGSVESQLEYEILIKAIRVNTLSKLTYADTMKFLSLINDVFPGIKSDDISGGELEQAIKEVMREKPFCLQEDPAQVKKMIQLKESLDQRMGCVIVGPSGCGKSSLWQVLKQAIIKCGQPVVTYVMNPKAMERVRLLGHMDADTTEWTDGVLTDAARKVVKESSEVRSWIICDGDVDPEWIESLNSVLDDNHLLTMPNGERISFGSNVNFLFETHDLKFASPATVSRMGMIFLSDDDLDVTRIVQRWVSSVSSDLKPQMLIWINELFYKALDFVVKSENVIHTTIVGTVMNGLSQIKQCKTKEEFICGLIRGLGGNLSLQSRQVLAKEVFQLANDRPPDISSPLDCYAEGNVYKSFATNLKAYNKGADSSDDVYALHNIEQMVVPTVSVQRTLAAINSWIVSQEPFILVGPEGCGKAMTIAHAFKQARNVSMATLHCNAQTTANDVVNKIAQSCSLFSAAEGRVYRPRDCERLVLYLKDINLPRPDMYDTCQLIAFLQQLLTFGGFYDENLEFLRIERIQIVASINAATTVGRHLLSTRFTATVRIFVVDYPETNELVTVYDKFLQLVLKSISLSENTWTKPSEREKLAYSIVEIYEKTKEKFTVDERRHYLFTPRDITSLVKNISRYNYPSESILASITHEAHRIFRDRLINADACNKFDQLLNGIMHSNLKYAVPDAAAGSYYTSLSSVTQGAKSEGKDGDDEDVSKQYTIGNKLIRLAEAEFKKIVEQGIMYYEREEKELHMLLISETLERICHIDRILSSNGGHILLAGSTGMGRRNMVSVVAYMLQYQVISPATSRDNPVKQFTIDVKSILYIAGVKGEHVVMLIEDYHIVVESILEIVNSLLSSGEVPGMYTHEELEPLIAPLREKMREDAGGDSGVTYRTPYDFFVARIRRYLHIVLCMDPANPKFVYRCESNPAIYSQCAVIWIGEWRLSSLKAIPLIMSGISSLLDENNDRIEDSKEEGKGESKDEGKSPEDFPRRSAHNAELLNMVIGIHNSCVTKLSSTPREYIAFLNTWYSLYNVKKTELTSELKHLEAGLSKLDSAAEIVNDLRTNAATQQKDLALAQAAADRAMEEISKALGSANERKNEVAEVKRAVAVNEEATKERKAQIESELAEIQPILDSAKQAVGQIKPEHLNEIRSLTAPPEAIADVLAAVLMLLGVQDLSWLSMKKFLTNRGVKEDIMNYDAKRIDATLRSNVAKLIKKKSASFDAANIQRVSIAAAPMAAWVKANIKYSIVIEKIEPLEAELNEEVMKLEQSQRRLQRCEDELKEIDERVANLKTEFGNRTAEADRLTRNLALAGTTLDKAEKLIGQLSGEQQRWKSQVKQLRSDLGKISVKALLAAGFCTYLAKCPEDVRSQMVDGWADITSVRGFSFKRVMSTESQLLQWKQMGLPADDLSHENSLVLYNTSNERVPFIIDPASACTTWLRSILSADRSKVVEVVSHHDPRFVNQVELAVRFGKVLIVLDLDGLEAMLYPLCRKDLMHQGSRWVVNIGEKTIDYNESFRLYLVTRNPEPDLPPDAAALVNQINYTVTRSGLEWQLLGIAIQYEQPELEKAKGEMLKREEDFKVQLGKLEKDLLEALATAEGNLLENTALIESLTRTKEKSAEIEESLLLSADASSKLDREREVYRVFALAGSKLFFLVKGLQAICVMYKFSLASFLSLYKQTLAAEMKAGSTEERLHLLCENLEIKVLHFIGRALFKADRPMFALHLVRGMNESQLQPKEWEIFTGALVSTGSKDTGRYPSWAAPERQAQYQVLSEVLPQLVAALEMDNSSKWSKFANAPDAERHIPSLRGVTAFQKVLITQALRPDRLQSVILQFCNDLLHVDSISPPTQYLSLPTLYSESTHTTPILLISSPGADPSKELQEFATKTVGINQYEELAMGGGQQEVAVHMLKSAASNGTWLCLKNLHLVVAWLPTLEKEISSLQNVQPEFRLWLTSESHQLFPTILLQQALKATYESPPGLKQNLQRVMESFDPHVLFNKKEVNEVKSKLLFLLAAFHSVIQERRTYIPQGWTKFYEFSFGDMRAGTFIIDAIADSVTGKPIDYETIYGLMEDAIYGGRIDNAVDMRILRAYLQLFFNDEIILRDNRSNEILKDTGLVMPKEISYESFINVISKLPDSDAPQTFCLPVNIERSLQRTTSANVIKQLRAMSTMDVEINKYDREKWRESLGPTLDMWKKMYDGVGSKGKGGKGSSKNNPIRDFIDMECNLTTELCSTIDAAIASLNKVLFGSGLLTPAIQATAIALLSDRVPGEWLSMWDGGPEKPQKWLREVVRKRNALQKLQSNLGQSDLSVALSRDSCMSLGDLFHPITFINALRQETARKLDTAIDKVKMVCSWKENDPQLHKICQIPCVITGMFLQGATYKSGMLIETSAEANEITPVGNVAIGFVAATSPDIYDQERSVSVPVYLSPSREDFLMELLFPVDANMSNVFVLTGTALFLTDEE